MRGKAHRVDRDKGVIYGVKILGLESVNDRRYSPEALAKAKTLYEGVGVYVNHPAKPNDPRGVQDRFGRLVNVRVESDGLYGDLEYLKSHPDAALITEAAERMPEQFGLSHNAKGEGAEDNGIFVVQEIVDVRSVDVVTEPATTGGMFEQRQKMAIKISQLFENSWKKFYAKKVAKRPKLAAYMKRLVEEDGMEVMDDDAEMEEMPSDHEEALRGGFCASCNAIVDKALDGDMEPKEALSKLKELITAHAKLSGGDDAEEDDMEEEEEPKKKEEEKKETEEQRARIKKIERENLVNREARKAGVTVDDDLMESLLSVEDEKAIKKLIAREKGKQGNGKGSAPRSGAGGGGNDTRATLEGVDTPEGVLAQLLG